MNGLPTTETVDLLRVRVYPDRQTMGAAAAEDVAAALRALLSAQPQVRAIFASAASQNEVLGALSRAPGIDWTRVTVFHMDEYLGLAADSPARFSAYLRQRLFDVVQPGAVRVIQTSGAPDADCARYAHLLAEAAIEVVCLGIGENGHIAFNDPPVADFEDPALVKVVQIDDASRHQQVHDGAFATFDDVPTTAITLTIPALPSGAHLFCVVPGPRKRAAVACTLRGPIATTCPAAILRRHPDATLYLDADAYPPP